MSESSSNTLKDVKPDLSEATNKVCSHQVNRLVFHSLLLHKFLWKITNDTPILGLILEIIKDLDVFVS